MQTVFSHIIQKRLSQVNEDVATDALAFILHSSESARTGMMKLLRGIAPGIPTLQFHTQQEKEGSRPDMWGIDGTGPRVFVENKFWAGLTDNQPVSYLKQLAEYAQPTILLVIVPEAREQSVWRDLTRRLGNDGISVIHGDVPAGIVRSITTEIGPILALTSWRKLLSALELEVSDDQHVRGDLHQLRALCEAADSEAFIPISSTDITDQRMPAFILQLSAIVQASIDLAVTKGVLSIKGLMASSSWERIGRYARFSDEQGVGTWFGIHFGFWKKHGGTPLWLLFAKGQFSRPYEVRSLIEPWASGKAMFTAWENNDFRVAIDVATGVERDQAVRDIVDRLKGVADELLRLGPAKKVLHDE
ncbi:MAG: hypothetical protein ABSD38_07035 [Syntrophorhabdales bacterium]|jgi:hypothetical protein